jgi:hypothetical protein
MKIGAGIKKWTKNDFLRLHLKWFSQYSTIPIFHYSLDDGIVKSRHSRACAPERFSAQAWKRESREF